MKAKKTLPVDGVRSAFNFDPLQSAKIDLNTRASAAVDGGHSWTPTHNPCSLLAN